MLRINCGDTVLTAVMAGGKKSSSVIGIAICLTWSAYAHFNRGGKMKRVNKVLLGAVGVAAMVASSVTVAGIANTRHNLGANGLAGTANNNHMTGGTAEICVFCHTPHASDSGAPVPLWNRNLQVNDTTNGTRTGFTTYDMLGTSTLDGQIAVGQGNVGSVSLACLSCHDGTLGMDSVLNAPGSGGVVAGGSRISGSWSGDRVDGTTGKMKNAGTFASMLATDLRNDHPVGIQYAGGCSDASYSSGNCTTYRDKDFVTASYNPTKRIWWVDTQYGSGTAGDNTRQVTDMILYSRKQSQSDTFTQPYVECASCHDPHVESKDAATQVQFLRVSQEGSKVCLACHNK